jgi:hypothetical protein
MTDHPPQDSPLDSPLGSPLGTALRDRVRDEHPDLDQLVRVATLRGTRIRRVRRAGASLAAVAGVAVVAVAGAQLTGSEASSDSMTPIASDPTAAPTTSPSPTAPSSAATESPVPPKGAPVYVFAPGWRCDDPADEKFGCTNGDQGVGVNWRPAGERNDYLDPGKADVLPGVHTYVSEVHGKWFATVAPVEGTTQASVNEVGAHLVWR